jgi:general secretion pathway protein G
VLVVSNNKMKEKSGFSLVELLVVSTIIALLATIGIVSYSSLSRQSRDSRRQADLQQLRSALEFYRSDNDSYPQALTDLVPSQHILSVPEDPKSDYDYEYCPDPDPAADYDLCAHLEQGSTAFGDCCNEKSCGGQDGGCNYKLTPLGEK